MLKLPEKIPQNMTAGIFIGGCQYTTCLYAGCVPGHMDPHGPTNSHVVGCVACYLLNLRELFWKMYTAGYTAMCLPLCYSFSYWKSSRNPLEVVHMAMCKFPSHVCGFVACVSPPKMLCNTIFLLHFLRTPPRALVAQNNKLHTKSMYIHERDILNFVKR